MTSSIDSSAHSPEPKEPLPKLSALPGGSPKRVLCKRVDCETIHYLNGYCTEHYDIEYPTTFPCSQCSRLCRSAGVRAEDYPGTQLGRNGLCATCRKPPKPKPEKTLTCEGGCGKLLRRNGLLLADYPGTQVVVARRRCYRCYTQGDYAEGENAVPDYQTHEETWIRTRVPDDLVHYFGIEV